LVAETALQSAARLTSSHAEELRLVAVGSEARSDPSIGWRSAIEDSDQDRTLSHEEVLVVAARDALSAWVGRDPESAERVIQRYLDSRLSVFRRLSLHALAENVDRYRRIAASAAVRRSFFHDWRLYHEYWRLVPKVFDVLSPGARQKLVNWVISEPGNRNEQEQKWFVYPRLKMLENCQLPADARKCLAELASELGEVEHPDFLVYSTVSTGWVSARSPVGLESKTPDDVITILAAWQPAAEPPPFRPSPAEGLGDELRRWVLQDLGGRAALAPRIGELKFKTKYASVYAWNFLDAFQEACRQNQQFDWGPLLNLADRLVPQGMCGEAWDDSEPSRPDEHQVTSWGSVRVALARLIEAGLETGREATILDSHLSQVRSVLLRLVHDPLPSPQEEQDDANRHQHQPNAAPMDWYGYSINTNRGQATHALIRYAIRYGNDVVRGDRPPPRLEDDVRAALGALAADPRRSIHAALGCWLGLLRWLDSTWFPSALQNILPDPEGEPHLWEAGWTAYLQYGVLNRELHGLLRQHYPRSIELCVASKSDDPHLVGLCKHLAAIYTWGWEELGDPSALVVRFYGSAEDDAASQLAQAFGHLVRRPVGAVDLSQITEQWNRIEALLRWRVAQTASDPSRHAKELRAFATWFDDIPKRGVSDLASMADVLDVITAVPPMHLEFKCVVEFLSMHADTQPGIAARLLQRILSNCERDVWYWKRDHMNSVLGKVFAAASDTHSS
jgi:hypothetical protein